eukprot:m51a1_g14782 hypothetical protein (132) ;mRNA; f:453371-453941
MSGSPSHTPPLTLTAKGFVTRGGEKFAFVHDAPPAVAPPKEKPAVSSYQQSFCHEHHNQFGKPLVAYRPDAPRNIGEPVPQHVTKATATNVRMADSSRPFRPAEHYQTTYQTTIASSTTSHPVTKAQLMKQ